MCTDVLNPTTIHQELAAQLTGLATAIVVLASLAMLVVGVAAIDPPCILPAWVVWGLFDLFELAVVVLAITLVVRSYRGWRSGSQGLAGLLREPPRDWRGDR